MLRRTAANEPPSLQGFRIRFTVYYYYYYYYYYYFYNYYYLLE